MLPIIVILTASMIVAPLFVLALSPPVCKFATIALYVIVLAYIIWVVVTGVKV